MTDAEIDRLRSAGHSEDEVFEVTVAAAVGAALRSLDAGLSCDAWRNPGHAVSNA